MPDNDMKIIQHTCKSFITHNNIYWTKKDENALFDVPMGAFFSAELCDLIGLFILQQLHPLYNDNEIGLYRDDGLAVINNKNNRMLEKKTRCEYLKR